MKLKYSKIMNFAFAQAIQKLTAAPTHGQAASAFHKLAKAITRARAQIQKEYQEKVAGVFGKKDEAGALIRPEGEPNGFEPIEEKMGEFEAAQAAFGETEIEVDAPSITLQLIGDIKVSAQDLDALGNLYPENREEDENKVVSLR
jgi:hypothetical protein